MRVSMVQMNSADDKSRNLDVAEELTRKVVAAEQPDLVILPEYFAFLGEGRDAIHANGEVFPDGPTYQRFSALAKELGVTLHLGTMVEKAGNGHYNATLVFGPDGSEIAKYRKIHLFDIDVPGGMSYRESDTISRGEQVVTYKVGDATVGCAICYDIRFPELFRALRDKGADVPHPTEYVCALKPLLDRYGNDKRLSVILFTLDETVYSRELAPLAGAPTSRRLPGAATAPTRRLPSSRRAVARRVLLLGDLRLVPRARTEGRGARVGRRRRVRAVVRGPA